MKYCFFCGEQYPDKTKMKSRGNYYCCPNCDNVMNRGITLIGYIETPMFEGQEPLSKLVSGDKEILAYPTSEWCTFGETIAKGIFTDAMFENIKQVNKRDGFVLIPDERIRELKTIYKHIKNNDDKNNEQEN